MSKSIAQWLIRRVEFDFDGHPWQLILTHRALLLCQEATGRNMLAENMGDPPAALVRAVLFSALSVAGATCTPEDIGRLIKRSTVARIKATVVSAWSASMPDPEPTSKEEDPEEDETPRKFGWVEAWAAGRQHHHLTDEEWLDMTPRQFRALELLRMEEMEQAERLMSRVASTIANFSAAPPKKPLEDEAFMLHRFPNGKKAKQQKLVPITGEHIMAVMKIVGRGA